MLLPTDGALRSGPPAPALGRAAALVLAQRDDPATAPAGWRDPAFAREVALVRAHLRPIRTRAGLASSFGREAFRTAAAAPASPAASAVLVAYAIRWLELRDGAEWPAWTVPAGPEVGLPA